MTTFYEAWKKAENEAEEAKANAKQAKGNGNKSNYEFWLTIFQNASKKADEMFVNYIERECKA